MYCVGINKESTPIVGIGHLLLNLCGELVKLLVYHVPLTTFTCISDFELVRTDRRIMVNLFWSDSENLFRSITIPSLDIVIPLGTAGPNNSLSVLPENYLIPNTSPLVLNLHAKLGHMNTRDIRKSIKKGTIIADDKAINTLDTIERSRCVSCMQGKASRSAAKSGSRDKHLDHIPFAQVHSDICIVDRKSKIPGFINFRCAFTGYTVIYLITKKSEAVDRIHEFINWVKTQFHSKGYQVLRLFVDKGKEYLNDDVSNLLTSAGITLHTTSGYSPASNGTSERHNLTTMNDVRTMLDASKLPNKFWPEAAIHSNYLRNFTYKKKLKDSPTGYLGLLPLDTKRLHTFGEFCVLAVLPYEGKTETRGSPAIYLGYDIGTFGHAIFVPEKPSDPKCAKGFYEYSKHVSFLPELVYFRDHFSNKSPEIPYDRMHEDTSIPFLRNDHNYDQGLEIHHDLDTLADETTITNEIGGLPDPNDSGVHYNSTNFHTSDDSSDPDYKLPSQDISMYDSYTDSPTNPETFTSQISDDNSIVEHDPNDSQEHERDSSAQIKGPISSTEHHLSSVDAPHSSPEDFGGDVETNVDSRDHTSAKDDNRSSDGQSASDSEPLATHQNVPLITGTGKENPTQTDIPDDDAYTGDDELEHQNHPQTVSGNPDPLKVNSSHDSTDLNKPIAHKMDQNTQESRKRVYQESSGTDEPRLAKKKPIKESFSSLFPNKRFQRRREDSSTVAGADNPIYINFVVGQSLNVAASKAILGRDNAPTSFRAATTGIDKDEWKKSIDDELSSHKTLGTWDPTPIITNDADILARTVHTHWVFTVKSDGRKKSRLVARGDRQNPETYTDISSPTLRPELARSILSLAASKRWQFIQMDIKTAYLNSYIDTDVYIFPPQGTLFVKGLPGKRVVYQLKRALYGLKQSGLLWHDTISAKLAEKDFKRHFAFPCTFVHHDKNGNVDAVIGMFVDDLILTAKNRSIFDRLLKFLQANYTVSIIKPDESGYQTFLGTQLQILRDGKDRVTSIKMNQSNYIDKKFLELKLDKVTYPKTPLQSNFYVNFESELCNYTDLEIKYWTRIYRELIGSLLYMSVMTRPDISYAVNYLSRFVTKPHAKIYEQIIRVFNYVQSTKSASILYISEVKNSPKTLFSCYSDSDYAQDATSRKSTNGFIITYNESPIHWKAKPTRLVCQSSTEAELQAIILLINELNWFTQLFDYIGLHAAKNKPTILVDNKSAIDTIVNGRFSNDSKHYAVRLHRIIEAYREEAFKIEHIYSSYQLADILTKPVSSTVIDSIVPKILSDFNSHRLKKSRGCVRP